MYKKYFEGVQIFFLRVYKTYIIFFGKFKGSFEPPELYVVPPLHVVLPSKKKSRRIKVLLFFVVLCTVYFFLSLYPQVLLNWGPVNFFFSFFFFFNDLGALFNKGFLVFVLGASSDDLIRLRTGSALFIHFGVLCS